MEGQGKGGGGGGAPDRPVIPQILLDATARAIKAGMKIDEFARAGVNQTLATESESMVRVVKKTKSRKSERKLKSATASAQSRKSEMVDDDEQERTYRNFEERRMGFLVIGDQHRFTGSGKGGKENFIFTESPPLDFSFCMINRIEEIVNEGEQPQTARNYRTPRKTPDERYRTSAVRLSYNVIDTMDGLINLLYKLLEGGTFGLCWLDLAFNAIAKLDDDALGQLPNLKILYLHGNSIQDMTEIPKLQALKSLRHLTLHGNPLEQEEGYRVALIYYLPDLLHLDYTAVTKSDQANSKFFGARYNSYWEKRHVEIEQNYQTRKKAAEISYTERIMTGGEDSDDDDEKPTRIKRKVAQS